MWNVWDPEPEEGYAEEEVEDKTKEIPVVLSDITKIKLEEGEVLVVKVNTSDFSLVDIETFQKELCKVFKDNKVIITDKSIEFSKVSVANKHPAYEG